MNWIRTLTPAQRRALFAAMAGWMFDAMDFLIYVLAIGHIKTYFGFNDAVAGCSAPSRSSALRRVGSHSA